MLREYSRTKAESLAQIRATITELQHFSNVLLAHPVYITSRAKNSLFDQFRQQSTFPERLRKG